MRRARVMVVAAAITATTVGLVGVTPAAAQLDPISPAADVVPFSPRRLLETRAGLDTVDGVAAGIGPFATGERLALDVAGRAGVPVGSDGVVLNVTVTDAAAPGFLTLWPCDEPQPLASNLNYGPGDTVANLAYVGLSGLGQVCIYAHAATDVVIDLQGYSNDRVPTAGLQPTTPERMLDTRTGSTTADNLFAGGGPLAADGVLTLDIAGRGLRVAPDLVGVAVNVTVVDPTGPGFLTAWPCGAARPLASNINFVAGQTIAALVIAGLGPGGRLCLSSSVATHAVVDLMGAVQQYHGGPSSFVPGRLLDTRPGFHTADDRFAGAGATDPGGTVELDVSGRAGVPTEATSVALTVTVTEPAGDGYVTAWPCGEERPTASNLNHRRGQTIANTALVRLGAGGRVCLFTQTATHLVVDVGSAWLPAEAPIAVEDLAWLTLPADLVLASRTIETISPDGQFAVMTGARANGGTFDGVVLVVDRLARVVHVGPVFVTGVAQPQSIGVVPAYWIDDTGNVLYRTVAGALRRWNLDAVQPFEYAPSLTQCDVPAPAYYVTLVRSRSGPIEAHSNCVPGGGAGYFMVEDTSANGRFLLDAGGIGQRANRLTDAVTGTHRPIPVIFRDGDLPASCRERRSQLLDNGTTGNFVRCGSFAFVRTVTADGFRTDARHAVGPTDEFDLRTSQSGWFPSGRGYWWTEGSLGSTTLHVHDVSTGRDLAAVPAHDCAFRAAGDVIWAVFCP